MSDGPATQPTAPAAASPKGKAKSARPKKAKTAPNHPKVADMVNAAITNLKERGGSSLQAIKKYIAGNYKVDVEKLAPFIRRYLKAGVGNGSLVQTKGKGASGSFKLSSAAPKPKKAGTKRERKPKAAGEKPKKSAAKPRKTAEKKTAKPRKTIEKKATKAKKPRAPKKEKKAKAPKKTKSPKPKKAAAKKPAAKK